MTRPMAARSPSRPRTIAQAQLAISAPVACSGVRGLSPLIRRSRRYSGDRGFSHSKRHPSGCRAISRARGPAVAGASAVVGPGGCFEGSISRRGMSRSCHVVTDNLVMYADVEHPSHDACCLFGSSASGADFCWSLFRGLRRAEAAEALMRGRSTAFSVRGLVYALSAWHPDAPPRRSALVATLVEET